MNALRRKTIRKIDFKVGTLQKCADWSSKLHVNDCIDLDKYRNDSKKAEEILRSELNVLSASAN